MAVDSVAKVGIEAPDAPGNAYVGATTTVRVTITDAVDFTALTAGQMTVTLPYVKL